MKKFIGILLASILFLTVEVCHAAQYKIHFAFSDYSRTELSEQIKNNIIKELDTIQKIEIVDARDSYVGEIYINVIITENPEHVIFFYHMFYKGRFAKGFYTGLKTEINDMCKGIVHFYIEIFEIDVQRGG